MHVAVPVAQWHHPTLLEELTGAIERVLAEPPPEPPQPLEPDAEHAARVDELAPPPPTARTPAQASAQLHALAAQACDLVAKMQVAGVGVLSLMLEEQNEGADRLIVHTDHQYSVIQLAGERDRIHVVAGPGHAEMARTRVPERGYPPDEPPPPAEPTPRPPAPLAADAPPAAEPSASDKPKRGKS